MKNTDQRSCELYAIVKDMKISPSIIGLTFQLNTNVIMCGKWNLRSLPAIGVFNRKVLGPVSTYQYIDLTTVHAQLSSRYQ